MENVGVSGDGLKFRCYVRSGVVVVHADGGIAHLLTPKRSMDHRASLVRMRK